MLHREDEQLQNPIQSATFLFSDIMSKSRLDVVDIENLDSDGRRYGGDHNSGKDSSEETKWTTGEIRKLMEDAEDFGDLVRTILHLIIALTILDSGVLLMISKYNIVRASLEFRVWPRGVYNRSQIIPGSGGETEPGEGTNSSDKVGQIATVRYRSL